MKTPQVEALPGMTPLGMKPTVTTNPDTLGIFDIDNSRSYATEDNLMAALAKLGFTHHALVVRNRAGRFTAIFGLGTYSTQPAFHGFKVIG